MLTGPEVAPASDMARVLLACLLVGAGCGGGELVGGSGVDADVGTGGAGGSAGPDAGGGSGGSGGIGGNAGTGGSGGTAGSGGTGGSGGMAGGGGGMGGTGGNAGDPGGPTIGSFTGGSNCSTSVVRGISIQIADEIECMAPGSFGSFAEGNGITFSGSAVLPFLAPDAITDLQAVAASSPIQINSAFRTVAQQYLLYEWFQQGRCGIAAAATPGNSNHETGRAVDLANWSAVVSVMSNHGWAHDVPGDDVHFDHLASPDLRGMDVHAFQRLWNRNHPNDLISEDGAYGSTTAA